MKRQRNAELKQSFPVLLLAQPRAGEDKNLLTCLKQLYKYAFEMKMEDWSLVLFYS